MYVYVCVIIIIIIIIIIIYLFIIGIVVVMFFLRAIRNCNNSPTVFQLEPTEYQLDGCGNTQITLERGPRQKLP